MPRLGLEPTILGLWAEHLATAPLPNRVMLDFSC